MEVDSYGRYGDPGWHLDHLYDMLVEIDGLWIDSTLHTLISTVSCVAVYNLILYITIVTAIQCLL